MVQTRRFAASDSSQLSLVLPPRAARVSIETNSGTHTLSLDFPAGEPENPVEPDGLVRKYDELARPVLGDDTDRVRDIVLDLDRQSSLAPLLDALEHVRAAPGVVTTKHDQAVAS